MAMRKSADSPNAPSTSSTDVLVMSAKAQKPSESLHFALPPVGWISAYNFILEISFVRGCTKPVLTCIHSGGKQCPAIAQAIHDSIQSGLPWLTHAHVMLTFWLLSVLNGSDGLGTTLSPCSASQLNTFASNAL